MAMHTVTVDVRDFEQEGTPPGWARLDISRATPDFESGRIVTTAVRQLKLVDGLGTTELEGGEYYRLLLRGVRGMGRAFYVYMPHQPVTVADLYSFYQEPPAGNEEIFIVDNQDGTYTLTGTGVADNGDGTLSLIGANVVDNGNGTLTF